MTTTSPRNRMHGVVGWLRERILAGDYAAGEWIRQDAVAEACGTSRIPVRDALRQLEAEGLVTMVPNAGARVAEIDAVELSEVYLLRERVEPLALALSIPRLTEDDIAALHSMAADLESAADAKDYSAWLEIDQAFHFRLLSAAPLRMLGVIESLWNATLQYRRTYVNLPSRLTIAGCEHALLLEAVRSGEIEDAELLLLLHIRRTRRTLQQLGQ